jgi:type IV secretory pathway VirB6-like protein
MRFISENVKNTAEKRILTSEFDTFAMQANIHQKTQHEIYFISLATTFQMALQRSRGQTTTPHEIYFTYHENRPSLLPVGTLPTAIPAQGSPLH